MRLLLVWCGFVFFAVVPTYGGEKPVIPPVAPHRQTTPEDNSAWKREPFAAKKGKNGVAGNNQSPAPSVKVLVKGNNEVAAEEDVILQGIMTAGAGFHALVNGRVVKCGDEIGGVTIHEINRYGVLVLNSKKEKVLYDIYQGRIVRGKK